MIICNEVYPFLSFFHSWAGGSPPETVSFQEGLETSVADKNSQDRRQSGSKDDKKALTMIGDCVVSSEAPLIESKANKPKTKRKRKFKNV